MGKRKKNIKNTYWHEHENDRLNHNNYANSNKKYSHDGEDSLS